MALIKANADRGHTHLDNFSPFALEVLRADPSRSFDCHTMAAAITEMLGINVPPGVAEAILKRLARQRKVVRSARTYTLALGLLEALPNLKAEQASFLRKQEALVDSFVRFASSRHGTTYDRESAGRALYSRIEAQTVDLLRVEVQGKPYRRPAEEDAYLVADFITEASRADSASYEAILAAAKGTMLAAALQVPNLERVDVRFSRTTLFLDAPLLLQLTGLEGPEAQAAIGEVLRIARSHGAMVACFAHSVEEAKGVILAAADARRRNRIPSRMYGVHAWAVRENIDYHDLLIRMEGFVGRLDDYQVPVVERPDHNPRIEVSEEDLRRSLEKSIKYWSDDTLLRDLDSLVAIHVLRDGRAHGAIETCSAVLITDNDNLAMVGRDFFSHEGHRWPVATTTSDLATILYLKDPQQASTIPSLMLIAEAYSALEPGSALWTRFLAIVEAQRTKDAVTAEDIALLCHSEESRRFLMEATLGRADHLSEDAVATVLKRAKEDASRPARREAEREKAERAKAEEAAAASTRSLSDAEKQVEALNARVEAVESSSTQQRTAFALSIRRRAERRARIVLGVAVILLGVLLAGPTVIENLGWVPPTEWKGVMAVLFWTGVGMGVLGTMTGTSVLHLLRPIQRPLQRLFARRMLLDAGLDPD